MNEEKDMSEKETKPIPGELMDIWYEYVGASEAKDSAVKGYFKYQLRNAIFFGQKAAEKRDLFWNKLEELYPELKGNIKIDPKKATVGSVLI